MFGYVNVNKKELSEEESFDYKSYYCGLCRQLKKEGGMKSQALLNYDITFLIIILSGLYELETEKYQFTCGVHPGQKKTAYINAATEYGACMDIALSYHNLMDDYLDTKNLAKRSMALSIKKEYESVKARYPQQVQSIEECMRKTAEAEQRGEENIDIISGYTGEMLSRLFVWHHDEWEKDLSNLGFYLGKYIYIIDAYEDLEEDMKKGHYNPLSYVQKECGDCYKTFVKSTLTSLMAECARSFEHMPILENASIIRNVLYSGIWTKYEYLQLKSKKKENV